MVRGVTLSRWSFCATLAFVAFDRSRRRTVGGIFSLPSSVMPEAEDGDRKMAEKVYRVGVHQ
jgi:hypothetical protein